MLDDFCHHLESEVSWDVLMLQEFCFTNEELTETTDGHLVFAQPPLGGQRRSAIILHARVAALVVNSSFQSRGRACCLDLDWAGWKLRLVRAHLFPMLGHLFCCIVPLLRMLSIYAT